MEYYANLSRKDNIYGVGDFVLPEMDTMKTTTKAILPTKWRPKYLGPLSIKENSALLPIAANNHHL